MEGIEQTVKEHGESINYYLFAAGNLVKSTLKLTPTILRDTIIYAYDEKKEQQLLSIQKMMGAAQMSNFGGFVSSLKDLLTKRSGTIENLTLEDGVGVLRILRGVREDEFDKFMKKVQTNIGDLKEDTHYAEARELLKDVFVGEKDREEYKTKLEDLKKQMQKLKGMMSSDGNLDMEQIKKVMGLLEQFPKTKA